MKVTNSVNSIGGGLKNTLHRRDAQRQIHPHVEIPLLSPLPYHGGRHSLLRGATHTIPGGEAI